MITAERELGQNYSIFKYLCPDFREAAAWEAIQSMLTRANELKSFFLLELPPASARRDRSRTRPLAAASARDEHRAIMNVSIQKTREKATWISSGRR